MTIYCNTLGAIYQYGKIQYRPSSSAHSTFILQLVSNDWSLGRAGPIPKNSQHCYPTNCTITSHTWGYSVCC